MCRINNFIPILTLLMHISSNEAGRRTCGGTYTAARGILATPNFPGPFDVPIRCQWVIDSSSAAYGSGNTSIIVYFTQLFTFEGLTFTEYQLYGNDYKINPKLIHKVNETNVFRIRWVQSYQSYLVIELKMQSSESAHIRVLDKFLDTYGFNITYEITTGGVRSPSCTMMDCGFTGICFDHYTKFSCKCFDGYSGPSCSEGPKSFCYTNGTPTCKNGGTCLHVGVAAVKCHCSKLFTGNTCETLLEPASAKGLTDCSNCPANCTYDDGLDLACNCFNGKVYAPNQLGVLATLHLGNLPPLAPNVLKNYLKLQLLKNLRTNLSKIEDLTIVNLIHYMSGADVTFQVVGSKKEEKKVKNVLNKWVDRGFVGNITVAENDNSIKTPLAIQSVDINQPGVIRENDEFILSCVARGSPSMTFRWFKDGTFVNLTFTRHKWIKLIKDPHVTDQYTALLAVGTARKYDEGKFTCQVEDFNIQQCKSKFVKVKRPPLVKIEPMSLTVRKGQNFTVKCVTLEGNGGIIGKYTYSWTKNKELLPVRTDSERYETLYPAGTILQVFGIEDSLTSSERSIQVHFLDKQVHPCSNETKYGLIWPETAPDTEYVQECPKDYSGIISRKCMLRDGKTPAWGAPDFSQCTGEFLRKVYEQFEVLKYGYGSASIESLFSGFLHYTSSVPLRPGEGTRILVMLNEILAFLNQTKLGKHTIQNLTQTAVSVLDSISSSPDALLRAKDINLLQTVLFHQLEISGFYLVEQDSSKALNLSLDTLDITVVRETPTLTMLYVPAGSKTLRDENEIQYQIFSQVVTFVPISSNLSKNENVSIKVDFLHKFSTDFFNATSKERWERYLMVFQTLLEMFVLVGISSHLSKLLIVFTELTEVPRSVSSKYTVVGIISGVPLITVFGNHLTYKTMNLKLRSWWLMENSLALNIFLIVINLILITCYVLKSETNLKDLFKKKPKRENSFFSIDSSGSLHFSTKQDADLDNQSGPNRHDIQLMSVKTIDTPKTSISKAQSLSNAFESCLHTSSNFCDLSVHESPAVYERDLESHSSYPSNKKQNSSNCMFQSPDILTTYVGLDLVACTTKPDLEEPDGVSRLHPAIKSEKKSGEHKTVRIMFPPQVIITPDDAISKILEAETIADQSQRTQPDGHAENQESDSEAIVKQEQETIASKPRQVTFREDNLDGVLDSISHDLDYLLNRNEDLTTELEVRKVSKLPGVSVINNIPEELVLHENSSSPEGIMLRTNC
ncbi:hypothetical protein HUJ05_001219 [Dendroctonus ponderosae]|nr:hypothetical protein HUJ05_001219 [Dendroctonus ponderosae]